MEDKNISSIYLPPMLVVGMPTKGCLISIRTTVSWHLRGGLQALNSKKVGMKVGERWHLSPKFSREFRGLQTLKSQFTLTKVRL